MILIIDSPGDLARSISELISRDGEVIFNCSQGEAVPTVEFITRVLVVCSRYDDVGKKYSITGVERYDFLAPGEGSMYNVLDNEKLTSAAGIRIRGWETALEDYLSRNGNSIIPA